MTAWVRKALLEHSKGKTVVMVYPIDKWVLMLLKAIGSEVRNLGDVRWLATEDLAVGKGTGRRMPEGEHAMKKKDFAAFQSSFLSKEDLTSPRVVTIENVTENELQGDGGKEMKPVAHFRGVDKGLVLNNINWDTIQDAYGDESDDWTGKQIELYFDPSIMFGSKRVGGIRIRLPRGDVSSKAAQPANGNLLTFDQAVTECGKVGVDKAKLVMLLKNEGLEKYSPTRDTPLIRTIIEQAGAEQALGETVEEEIPF